MEQYVHSFHAHLLIFEDNLRSFIRSQRNGALQEDAGVAWALSYHDLASLTVQHHASSNTPLPPWPVHLSIPLPPSPTSSTPWYNNAALSSLAYPSAVFKEERWADGPARLEGSGAVEEDRKNALSSSLTTSILSILHLNVPTTLPSGHITITSTDTTDRVPGVSDLWVTGRGHRYDDVIVII